MSKRRQINVRVSEEEFASLVSIARDLGVPVSELLRSSALNVQESITGAQRSIPRVRPPARDRIEAKVPKIT